MANFKETLRNNLVFVIFATVSGIITVWDKCVPFISDILNYFEFEGTDKIHILKVINYSPLFILLIAVLWRIVKKLYLKIKNIYHVYTTFSQYTQDDEKLLRELLDCGIVEVNTNFKKTGERITDYENLREKSKRSILLMGIGMTHISQNEAYIEEQLVKGIDVKILMINHEILSDKLKENKGFYTTREIFNSFFDRKNYSQEVKSSFYRLKDMTKRLSANPKHKIEMRVYSSFYPINLTVIDEQEEYGELIIEFCCPNTTSRIRFRVKRKLSEEFFSICMKSVNSIWKKAVPV